MLAVYDANVLASGFVSGLGSPGRCLDAWRSGEVTLVHSEHILGELGRTLAKPYFCSRLSSDQISRFLVALREHSIMTPITAQVRGVATHPEDDLVLATAVSVGADYLVTGDQHFRRQVPTYRGVILVSPTEFLEVVEAARP